MSHGPLYLYCLRDGRLARYDAGKRILIDAPFGPLPADAMLAEGPLLTGTFRSVPTNGNAFRVVEKDGRFELQSTMIDDLLLDPVWAPGPIDGTFTRYTTFDTLAEAQAHFALIERGEDWWSRDARARRREPLR
jgi:hypothetical protein